MPNRILREGILTSPRMSRLGWAEEVFYRRLHSVVDDFGRYYADEGLLRAACYPRQLNKVSDSDIGKWLRACVDAALVRVYPAEDGESYLEVLDFSQQVRAKKSRFPNPLSTCVADAAHAPSKGAAPAPVFVSVDVSVDEGVSESDAAAPAPASAPPPPVAEVKAPRPVRKCPTDFAVTDEMREWSEREAPRVDVDRETDKFRDHTFKTAISDWPGAWRNWLRKAAEYASGRAGTATKHSGFAAKDYREGVAADGSFS